MSARSNVYGPRPANAGFRCETCGEEDFPLFAVENGSKRRYKDFTFCFEHLIASLKDWGMVARVSKEARPHLKDLP